MLNIKNYVIDYETCKCGGEFIHIDHKGMVVCNKCAVQKQFLIEHEKPSYKEPPKEVPAHNDEAIFSPEAMK